MFLQKDDENIDEGCEYQGNFKENGNKTLGIRKIVKTSGTHNEEKGLENLTFTGTY